MQGKKQKKKHLKGIMIIMVDSTSVGYCLQWKVIAVLQCWLWLLRTLPINQTHFIPVVKRLVLKARNIIVFSTITDINLGVARSMYCAAILWSISTQCYQKLEGMLPDSLWGLLHTSVMNSSTCQWCNTTSAVEKEGSG